MRRPVEVHEITGPFSFDRLAHRVWVDRGDDREEVALTVFELRLLSRLFDACPQVRTRESLGPAGECIRTVRSIGHRLLGPDEMARARDERGADLISLRRQLGAT